MTDRLTNPELRRLFLERHGLCGSAAGPLTPDGLDTLIERLGFVQVDTISTLEQAHHHILFTRANGYRSPAKSFQAPWKRTFDTLSQKQHCRCCQTPPRMLTPPLILWQALWQRDFPGRIHESDTPESEPGN